MEPGPLGDVFVTYKGRRVLVEKGQALYDAGDPEQVKRTDAIWREQARLNNIEKTRARRWGQAYYGPFDQRDKIKMRYRSE